MSFASHNTSRFADAPFLVFYELTRACDLVCRHCRACAQPHRHPRELETHQSAALIDELARFDDPPLLVLTGGDPFKRDDVFDQIEHARAAGLRVAMTPSATPLVTMNALLRLRELGLSRLALSLDGADADTHDAFRGMPGSFEHTLQIAAEAQTSGLPLQINTTITQHNVGQIDAMAAMLADIEITLWSVFFLVPVGRGLKEQRIKPEQYEQLFHRLWYHAQHQPFGIKTTEAPHYRRFVLQREGNPQRDPVGHRHGPVQRAPLGINDGNGVMFISHTGQIFPSGFLPLECGRFPRDSVIDTYRHAPLFQKLRAADQLKGKCGVCEYRRVCGGSRARAYAVCRDPLAAEPDCVYQPRAWRGEEKVTCSA